eukprot:CAMPEP_0195053484 /NCGR_PEP_ID=MMETSP0448-20130528/2587_1 /TAXON_ID=66468 /ORGANISM="Heterocapsa triquestra, Strain CCMP 448" /LENGTH=30 /DNA_ID= /DNA_START= /DNA_END= /DNA_ORIENTATION=
MAAEEGAARRERGSRGVCGNVAGLEPKWLE